jgi:hypothetical protein
VGSTECGTAPRGTLDRSRYANLVEEIQNLGAQWRLMLDSHTMHLLAHLLKLGAQPDYPGIG